MKQAITLQFHPDWPHAHVHGPVHFDTDVERAARSLGCAIEFHPGFRASPDLFDPAYRGPEVVALARALGDVLTPAAIGDAARSGAHDRQRLKQVWHCLARFGRSG